MSDNESDTTMTVEFAAPRHRSINKSNARSASQDDQLANARNVALTNRRVKSKAKLEARLAELRAQLGTVDNEQLEKVVKHLIRTEEHHRSKLLKATDRQNEQINKINDSLHRLSAKIEQMRAPPTRIRP